MQDFVEGTMVERWMALVKPWPILTP